MYVLIYCFLQSCPTLSNPMDCSLPGSSIHGIFQARVLEWGANLDSILKSGDITLPTKIRLVKAVVFPVVMYGCESWTIRKAECRIIDVLNCGAWTARRFNQSILKETSPGCSLEGLMLKLKLQYFSHLMEELTHLKRP